MQDHKLFSKKVNQNVREAIWQWLIDHSKPADTGFYHIQFYLKDEDDFWKRVHYRYTGQYERYNKEERASRMTWTYMKAQQRGAQEFGAKCDRMEKDKLYYKLIVWLYRTTRNIIRNYGEHTGDTGSNTQKDQGK